MMEVWCSFHRSRYQPCSDIRWGSEKNFKKIRPRFWPCCAASFAGFVFRNLGDMNSEIQRQAGVIEGKSEDSRPLSGRGF